MSGYGYTEKDKERDYRHNQVWRIIQDMSLSEFTVRELKILFDFVMLSGRINNADLNYMYNKFVKKENDE